MACPEHIVAFVSQCEHLDPESLALLASLEAPADAIDYICHQSLHGDQKAVAVVQKITPHSPFHRRWTHARNLRLAEWFTKHNPLVMLIYQGRMRLAKDEAADYAQEFWFWFRWQDKDIKFNSAAGTEEKWISILARRQALTKLKSKTSKQQPKGEQLDENAHAMPAEEAYRLFAEPKTTAPLEPTSPLLKRLSRLVLTDSIQPHEALIMIASRLASLSMAEIETNFADSTLFAFYEQVAPLAEEKMGQEDPPPLPELRARLNLPQESPYGLLTLRQIAHAKAAEKQSDKRTRESRTLGSILQYWSSQASRVLQSELTVHGRQEREALAKQIEERFHSELQQKLDFLQARLAQSPQPIEEILWACLEILNLPKTRLEALTFTQAASVLRDRLNLIVPGHATLSIIDIVAENLLRHQIGAYLKRSESSLDRIKDTVDSRYRGRKGARTRNV